MTHNLKPIPATMTQTHTPGPWKFSFESVDPSWAIVTDSSGGIVANVNSETGPDHASAPAMRHMPRNANAALIAAAPDLLAEAEANARFLDQLAAHLEANNMPGQAGNCTIRAKATRAAIAKGGASA